MRSQQAVCNAIKSIRTYARTNFRPKRIFNRIDEEDGRVISVNTQIQYNLATGNVSVSECIVYCHKMIYPGTHGKQNCNDPVTLEKYTGWMLKHGSAYSHKQKVARESGL